MFEKVLQLALEYAKLKLPENRIAKNSNKFLVIFVCYHIAHFLIHIHFLNLTPQIIHRL